MRTVYQALGKQAFDTSAILFGWSTGAFRAKPKRRERFLPRPGELRRRRQVFGVILDELGPDAGFQSGEHFDRLRNLAGDRCDGVAGSHKTGGLDRLATDSDVSASASISRLAPGFVEADGPKPFIHSHRARRLAENLLGLAHARIESAADLAGAVDSGGPGPEVRGRALVVAADVGRRVEGHSSNPIARPRRGQELAIVAGRFRFEADSFVGLPGAIFRFLFDRRSFAVPCPRGFPGLPPNR